MSIELKITYDGTEPGLQEHRLSLSSFGRPLGLLLNALRRTASGILSQALDNPEYGKKGGKFADLAKLLDLELASVEKGSACPTFICTARPRPVPVGLQTSLTPGFDDDIMTGAVERLLKDIDAERTGRVRNAVVRQYLAALPRTVTRQRYTATRNGVILADVSFGETQLADLPPPLPRLVKVIGSIASVGFEHGSTFVALKTKSRTIKCSASPQQVDEAVALHTGAVLAAVLDGERSSLIWIRSAEASVKPPDVAATAQYATSEWKSTLEALAR